MDETTKSIAEKHFEQAIKFTASSLDAEASNEFSKYCNLMGRSYSAYWNCGMSLYHHGRYLESYQYFLNATLSADRFSNECSLSYRFLGQLKFQMGLMREAEEYLLKSIVMKNKEHFMYWDGKEFCDEIIVLSQGVGDSIIAMRNPEILKQFTKKASLYCEATNLTNLVKLSDRYDYFYSTKEELHKKIKSVNSDKKKKNKTKLIYSLEMMAIGNSLQNISRISNYLVSDEDKDRHWAQVFKKNLNHPVIGLCWQGKKTSPCFPNRSFRLKDMEPLCRIKGAIFVSLQANYGSDQFHSCSFKDRFVSFQDEIELNRDFLNTASIMKQCDLIVSCDTGIAHLSCALGIKTLVMLKEVPSFYWGNKEEHSLLYKNCLTSRQRFNEDWTECFKRTVNSLIYRNHVV